MKPSPRCRWCQEPLPWGLPSAVPVGLSQYPRDGSWGGPPWCRKTSATASRWGNFVAQIGSIKYLQSSIWMTKEQHVCPASVSYIPNGAFQSMGVPPNHSFYQIFHEININKPSSHWGTPMAMAFGQELEGHRLERWTFIRQQASRVPSGRVVENINRICSVGRSIPVCREREREIEIDIYICIYIYIGRWVGR